MQLRILPGGRRAETPEAAPSPALDADRSLLAGVVQRDHSAHRALFDRYFKRVFSFVRRRVSDDSLAEEITVDVFFEVWRNAKAYRGESPVSTWIFGIANLKVLTARRFYSQPRRAAVNVASDEKLARFADPHCNEEKIQARDELARVLEALERLPEGQRDVLRMAFLEGRSYPEIAESLAITEANVKTRVNRARTRLRNLARFATED